MVREGREEASIRESFLTVTVVMMISVSCRRRINLNNIPTDYRIERCHLLTYMVYRSKNLNISYENGIFSYSNNSNNLVELSGTE